MAKKNKTENQQGAPVIKIPQTAHCQVQGCRQPDKRFGFCDEHYEHFKFGLIRKDGHQVPDYFKKYEHYITYKTELTSKKVA